MSSYGDSDVLIRGAVTFISIILLQGSYKHLFLIC